LLEQIAIAMRYGHIPLNLAVTLSAPDVLQMAWTEMPFTDVPFSELPGGEHVAATRLRGASVFTKTTDFDGPNVYVEVLLHTRPQMLFAALRRLLESIYGGTHGGIPNPADEFRASDLRASEVLQQAGDHQAALHWATQLTRGMVSRLCGFQGNRVPPGPCSDAPIVNAIRACGPPTLAEIVAAAARQADWLLGQL
jgi:hypothetical protein